MTEKSKNRFWGKTASRGNFDPKQKRVRNRQILKYCLCAFLTVDTLLGVFLVGLIFLHLPYFNLQQVDVVGNQRLSRAEVIEASEMEYGINLLTVDLSAVASRLRRHPWIRTSTVYRRFPGQLIVEIEERTPRAILAAEKLFYVDEQAEFFTRLLPGDPVNFPLFTGIGPEELKTSRSQIQEMIRGGLVLLDNLEKSGCGVDAAEVSQIRLTLDDGMSLHTKTGRIIVIGKGDFEQKMQRYGRLKKFLTQRGEWHNARIINLDFEDRAIVRSSDKALLQG
ncbi:MAG: FtsQ-type POTRA domain-containing protein [Desulfomonile sp.]|jgi:cell division protein FtsQ|nr:FtsQ-type POTRA domain-containing protein [Deltaproteobacteria bacterium]